MRTTIAIGFGLALVLFMVVTPIVYSRWQEKQYRNFSVVEPGILYRGGQLTPKRLDELVTLHGIRTIVNLRDGVEASDQLEESWAKEKRLNFVRIPAKSWGRDASGNVPANDALEAFRRVMDDPGNYPVYVHCYAGIHRTGTMVAIYRMDYQGWTTAEAMTEMRMHGYTILDQHADVSEFMALYRSKPRGKGVRAMTTARGNVPLP